MLSEVTNFTVLYINIRFRVMVFASVCLDWISEKVEKTIPSAC